MEPTNCGTFVLNAANLFLPGMIYYLQKKNYRKMNKKRIL